MSRIDPKTYGNELCAFLDTIAYSEGTSTIPGSDDGYNVLVGGHLFTGYAEHPVNPPGIFIPRLNLYSTAAGRYQLLHRYFQVYQKQLNLPDFSPLSQDLIAIQQMKERSAYKLAVSGQIVGALIGCNSVWASLPGSDYGQHVQVLDVLVDFYHKRLATITEDSQGTSQQASTGSNQEN